MKLLFVDTETGGLNPDLYSLLSVGLVVWDSEHNRRVGQEFLILDDVIRISPEAQRVNKIDYNNFIEKALNKRIAREEITRFIFGHFPDGEKITLVGHNVSFDIGFLKRFFGDEYSKMFSHRCIDTASILKFMFLSGRLKDDFSSSSKAFEYFGINVMGRHTALGDALATANLFDKLLLLNKGERGDA